MRFLSYLTTLLMAAVLAGCGGAAPASFGGGSKDPMLKLALQTIAGVSTNSIAAFGYTLLNVRLTDPSGNAIPNQVVEVSGDTSKITFPEGTTALTSSGFVAFKLARASVDATGAGVVTVTYNYKAGSLTKYPDGSAPPTTDMVVTASLNYQIAGGNITLTNMNVGVPTLAAYGTRIVSVQVNIDGAAATSTPVSVSFIASCGTVAPASASTNSQGIVQVSYSAINTGLDNDQGCSNTVVSIVASALGATPVSSSLGVDIAAATNLMFVDALPSTIYLAGSGGVTQSVIKFRLINSSNAPILGQNVLLELKDLAGGIPKTSFGTVGNVNPVTLTTNSSGEVSVAVFSGPVPTSVSVKASLVSNPAISTTSSVLAIASGRPAQSRLSLAVTTLAIEGAQIDGVTTDLTLSMADRQGNPVPDGTAVNFVTEGGVMIPPTCTTVNSRCSSTLRSQNPRPPDGLVSILAYAQGDEDFVDLNFDNVYTAGEPFDDLGNAFRWDGALTGGTTGPYLGGYFSVPRAGSVACAGGFLGRPNSCDGVWGAVDVRQQAVVAFSTSQAEISNPVWGLNTLTVTIADLNGNSMPMGSAIAVAPSPETCTVNTQSHTSVPNTLAPISLQIELQGCVSGDKVKVTVTSPSGVPTPTPFTVP